MNGYRTADYTWDFTNQDTIDLNRAGQLTPRQRDLLLRFSPWQFGGCIYVVVLIPLLTVPFWLPGRETLPTFIIPLYLLIFGGLSLLLFGYSLFAFWRGYINRQEIRQNKIVGGHGQVFRTGRGYMARVGRKKLRTFALNKVDLLPGNYYFFYLPRSGYLLSAESLEVNDLLGAAELTEDLGDQFGFNDNDLEMNRNGRLSARQRLRLFLQGAFFGVVLMIVLIVGPVIMYLIYEYEGFELFSFQTGAMAVIFLAFVSWIGYAFVRRIIDAVLGQSRTQTGQVQMQYRSAGRSTELYYVVNGHSFQVGLNDYYSLVEGLVYNVHYTHWSKRIMSIEPVPPSTLS